MVCGLHPITCCEAVLTIPRLLARLDPFVSSGDHTLDEVARSNSLFVRHEVTSINSRALSVKELCEVLIIVKEVSALSTCESETAIDCVTDHTYAANLEHLLLCLQQQLLCLLVERLVELLHRHVADCQRDRSKHVEAWFFEFPDARHPLSTTWPWNIKPSLAVIWGVCWQFYESGLVDDQGNVLDDQGRIICLREDLPQTLERLESDFYQPHMTATGESSRLFARDMSSVGWNVK